MKIYIATVFLLHGLSPVAGLSFGFFWAAGFLLFTLVGTAPWRDYLHLRKDDFFFGAIYLLGAIPLIFKPNTIGVQNLTYLLLWIGIWIVCYWWVREWGVISQISFLKISQAATFGSLILSLAVIFEFVLANTSGQYISDFVPFSIETFPPANVLGAELNRPRGFSSEAGFTSIAFECLLPLALYSIVQDRRRLVAFSLVVIPAYFLLFSAASISFFFVTLFIALWIFKGYRVALSVAMFVGITSSLTIALSSTAANLFDEVLGRKFLEFLAVSTDPIGDTFSRAEAYALGFTILSENPFGIGWGTISQHASIRQDLLGVELRGSGLISFPLEIAAASGWLGLFVYLTVIFRKLHRLVRTNTFEASLIFFSLLWVSLHHTVVLEMWFPMIWLSMALADIFSKQGCLKLSMRTQSKLSQNQPKLLGQ